MATRNLAPEAIPSTGSAEYNYRVLFLSGRWELPDNQQFRLRATIYVYPDGCAEGAIYWQALVVGSVPCSYFANEQVRGYVQGRSVELRGVAAERPLFRDRYRMSFSGDEDAGSFGGISRAFGDGNGRMEGTYLFRNRR